MPESTTALHTGGDAIVHERIHTASFFRGDVVLGLKPFTSPPKQTGKPETSKRWIGPLRLSPFR